MSLSGKRALVTGGGRGIGRAIALRLASEGAHVVAVGRTADEVHDTAQATGGTGLVLDIADRSALEGIRERAGAIAILVNNAGVAESATLSRTTDEMWDRAFAVNVTAAFLLCRAFVPEMVEAGFGRVINVASTAGITGFGYTAAYCASKHALVGLTRALAMDVAKSGVTVNAVCPGWVRTRMTDESISRIVAKTGRTEGEARQSLERMSPQGRLVEPDEVAHAVATLCADGARSIHGQTIVVDGGQVMK